LCVIDFVISTKKHPSPLINPENQLGFFIAWFSTIGLETVVIPGKDSFKIGLKPSLREARKLTILLNPSILRCSLLFIKSIIDLNRRKSARF
jgi:hypothetical protein